MCCDMHEGWLRFGWAYRSSVESAGILPQRNPEFETKYDSNDQAEY
ncbi:hypothetical protein BOSEA31B_10352 [Hyphomicrobiales bacterium]|nr:hypothetical protein BOSEA31B_10352 [Hyphomicrobiales bacterium]CAH1702033.1 hypothetical protein BOSEA1005_21732 [Hyphomicrobiales bacterium]CAI0346190.1 hypothetical protein BO1005MUT1_490002 [Hyphomicrobiales bacterium]